MDSIKKLTDLFANFPTIGQRTASRFVFYLVNQPKEKISELVQAIQDLRNKVSLCNFCFNPHELQSNLCQICQNPTRNKKILCVVEKEADLISIEKTKKYNGLYFILGGLLGFKKTENDLRINQLKERIKYPEKFGIGKTEFSEIIVALNPVLEGKTTSILVEKSLKDIPYSNIKITHLAQGLPVGGELEYADEETLESAFEGRK